MRASPAAWSSSTRAASDPLFERRFHRRVRLLGGLILAVDLIPLAAYLLR